MDLLIFDTIIENLQQSRNVSCSQYKYFRQNLQTRLCRSDQFCVLSVRVHVYSVVIPGQTYTNFIQNFLHKTKIQPKILNFNHQHTTIMKFSVRMQIQCCELAVKGPLYKIPIQPVYRYMSESSSCLQLSGHIPTLLQVLYGYNSDFVDILSN